MDHLVRLALGADIALQQRQFWGAQHLLQQMRDVLFELFAHTHNGTRTVEVFQRQAEPSLQARVVATLPHGSLRSAQQSLSRMLDIAEQDLVELSNGHIELTPAHRKIIQQVRKRQALLQLPDELW